MRYDTHIKDKGIEVPAIGQTVKVRGQRAVIIAIHPFGTIDVQLNDGRCYRISGLAFEKEV